MTVPVLRDFPELENVDFYITTACDRSCGDCMSYDIRVEEGIQNMNKRLFFSVMDQLSGIKSVHLAGVGEVSQHPDFLEFLDYASKRAKTVRINTNGQFLTPLYGRLQEAKDFMKSLPKNLHIYLSVDKYHEKENPGLGFLVPLLKYFSGNFQITYNVRVIDKEREEKEIKQEYGLESESVTNRVLRMGKGKNIKNAVYVDLSKILDDYTYKPMVGILHDGTVVPNFIMAYLPRSNRPRKLELGNLHENTLFRILERYRYRRTDLRSYEDLKGEFLNSMIDDMKNYPFVIDNHEQFNWYGKFLKDKMEEIRKNTVEFVIQELEKVCKPVENRPNRLISTNGNLHLDYSFPVTDAKERELWKNYYYSMFKEYGKIKIKNPEEERIVKDRIVKWCVLLDSTSFTSSSDSYVWQDFWEGVYQKTKLPEEEFNMLMSRLITNDVQNGLFHTVLLLVPKMTKTRP